MLTILALHRGHLNAEIMCAELYGDDGHPASVRVEMSRLRRLLLGALKSGGYQLTGPVDSDVRHVRALLDRGAVREAAEAYPGPLLPGSAAPCIERARDELDGWIRQAVITSEDADALWAWVRSVFGRRRPARLAAAARGAGLHRPAPQPGRRAHACAARGARALRPGRLGSAPRRCSPITQDRRAERVALASRGG